MDAYTHHSPSVFIFFAPNTDLLSFHLTLNFYLTTLNYNWGFLLVVVACSLLFSQLKFNSNFFCCILI